MKIKKLLVLEALLSFLIKRCVYSGPLLGAFRTLLAGSGMLTVKTGSVPDPFQKVLERCQLDGQHSGPFSKGSGTLPVNVEGPVAMKGSGTLPILSGSILDPFQNIKISIKSKQTQS